MRVVGGIVLMLIGGLWALFWGFVALAASAFGSDGGVLGWVLVLGATAIGALVFVYGAAMTSGQGGAKPRPPTRSAAAGHEETSAPIRRW